MSYPYHLKRFVKADPNSQKSKNIKPDRKQFRNSGEEIKDFYDRLISEPSTSGNRDKATKNSFARRRKKKKSEEFWKYSETGIEFCGKVEFPDDQGSDSGQNQEFSGSEQGQKLPKTEPRTPSTSPEPDINRGKRSHRYFERRKSPRVTFQKFLTLCMQNSESALEQIGDVIDRYPEYLEQTDFYGWTPLMVAAFEGLPQTVALLLNCGAEPSIKNPQGNTALDLLRSKQHRNHDCQLVENLLTGNFENAAAEAKEPTLHHCAICRQSYSNKVEHESSVLHQISLADQPGTSDPTFVMQAGSPGYRLLVKSGWDERSGLGKHFQGRKFPVKTVLKRDRTGLGTKLTSDLGKAKITHFGPNDPSAVARSKVKPTQSIKRRVKHERHKELIREKNIGISFRRDFA